MAPNSVPQFGAIFAVLFPSNLLNTPTRAKKNAVSFFFDAGPKCRHQLDLKASILHIGEDHRWLA